MSSISESYYVASAGQEFGPVSEMDVRRLIQIGEIQLADRIRGGDGRWITIADFLTVRDASLAEPPVHSSTPSWMIRLASGILGPLSTEEFISAVRRGEVRPTTSVQLKGDGRWFYASEISGLEFPESSSANAGSAPSEAPALSDNGRQMRAVIAECARQQQSRRARTPSITKPLLRAPVPGILRGGATSLRTGLMAVLRVVCWLVFTAVRPLFCLVPSRLARSRWAWGLASVGILLGAGMWIATSWTSQTQAYTELNDVWQEYRRLRVDAGQDGEWQEFQSRALSQLEQWTPRLTRSARADDRISILLLWIARDYLPLAIRDPGRAAQAERHIESHLQTIHTALEAPAAPLLTWDRLALVIVIADVIGIGGAAWYFRRSLHFRGNLSR